MQDIQIKYATNAREIAHAFYEQIAQSMKETARVIRVTMEEFERAHEEMVAKTQDMSLEMDAEIEARLSQTAEQQRLLSDFFLGKVGNAEQQAITESAAAIPAFSELRARRASTPSENEAVAQAAAE